MRNVAGFASSESAPDVPSEPTQADDLDEARDEATESIVAKGREQGFWN
jgi:hypothetical protein